MKIPSRSTFSLAKPAFLYLALLCFCMTGSSPVAAQPRISVQPGNVAIQLGQDAVFTVTARSVSPLAYQWRFEGEALAGATGRTLTVTNIAWSDFGRYEVLVSDTAGAVLSDPAWLLVESRFTELVVFGASGEFPFCGGLAWPEYLVNRLGIRLRNYGGGLSAGVRDRMLNYLTFYSPTNTTLIGLWQGEAQSDLRDGASVQQGSSNRLANVRLLAAAGTRNFLIPTLWPPEMIPAFLNRPGFTSAKMIQFDAQVTDGLKALQREYALTIYRPDMFAFFTAIRRNPAAYGFSAPLGSDSTYTCDGLHFALAVHRLCSQEFYDALTSPLRISAAARTLDGQVSIDWIGGSPPFRLERASDLHSGQWKPVGELGSSRGAMVKPASPREFYRVLFFGQ